MAKLIYSVLSSLDGYFEAGTYGHLFPSLQEVATQRLEELDRARTGGPVETPSQDTRLTQGHAKDTGL